MNLDFPPNDPIAAMQPTLGPGSLPLDDGMTLHQLENILSDIRFQPKWRDEANKAADYFDGNQLDQERLARMDRLGIPPLVTNLVAPSVRAVLGMEAKSRTDWRVIEEDPAQPVPAQLMDALNMKLTSAERESRADQACSDAYAGMVKAGVGWVEVARSLDPFDVPYRVQSIHRDEMFWDWRGKRLDTLDWRYQVRKRRYDLDELTAMMPEHEKLIKLAVEDRFSTWQWETRDQYDPSLARAIDQERITNLDSSEWRDAERGRATLFEVWYRKWVRGYVLKLPNGTVLPYKPDDPRHAEVVRAGVVMPQDAAYTTVRMAIYLGPHRLYDVPSPYPFRNFPYVPFIAYREDKTGVPYGLIRSMISPQDTVNSADARMHWMMTARRLVAHSDAIDTRVNSWAQVQQELARPDAVVLLDPNKPGSKFEVQQDFQLNAQQFERRQQAAADIENAGGVYRAMMGKEGAATSGVAISSLVEQGSVALADMNANYHFARRQVGEMLFSLVKEDIGNTETPVSVGQGKRKQIVVMNQRMPDGTIANKVSAAHVKVVLSDVPSTPGFRAQQLVVLGEVVKSLPPEMQILTAPTMFSLTDVPDRDDLVEKLKKLAGISDASPEEEDAAAQQQAQQQALMAEMQMRAMNADTADKEAKAAKAKAEAEKIMAEIQFLGADNGEAQRQVQAVMEQAQAAQMQMEKQLRAAQDDANRKITELQQALAAQQASTDVKRYEIDSRTAIDRERLNAEHVARLAEIDATRRAAQDQAEVDFTKQADTLTKQLEEIKKMVSEKPEPVKEPAPAEPPVINVTVPVTIERGGGNKTVALVPGKNGGYTAQVKEGD